MVDEDSRTNSEDEETKLRHDTAQICHTEYLGTNYTAYSNWRYPHDCTDHLHDDFINDFEEVNDNFCFLPKRSKNCAKGQAEEYNSQGVGARPKPKTGFL